MYCTWYIDCAIHYTYKKRVIVELLQCTNTIVYLQFNLRDVLLYLVFTLFSPPKSLTPM